MNGKTAKKIRKIAGPKATKSRVRALKRTYNKLTKPMRAGFLDSMQKLANYNKE